MPPKRGSAPRGDELRRLSDLDLVPGDGLYERAFEKQLIAVDGQRSQLQLLAARLRSRMAFLRSATPLHIFVVTLRCEHSCPYCQVSRRSADRERYDMSIETALRGLAVALSAPSPIIKIEFQGGEPLLNFELIRSIVPPAKERAAGLGKQVEFVITTNLALLTDEVLDFCREHSIHISTSLDGPADLHNRNRPRPGRNSHELVVDGIRRVRETLGPGSVGALMTTTEASLNRVEEIVDEYVRLDLGGIFLRPLSPYGFAVKTKQFFKYGSRDWLVFYERGLRYILEINKRGIHFPEFYSALLLRRMLTDRPIGYVDLRTGWQPANVTSIAPYAAASSTDSDDSSTSPESSATAATGSETPYEDIHGSADCTEDCSGHEAGYKWAQEHDITDESECGGNSQSFIEGCEAYARDHERSSSDSDEQ